MWTITQAKLYGNNLIVVTITRGSGITLELNTLQFGRTRNESANPFKVRVKATMVDILAVLNNSPSETDVTSDIV